MNSVDWKPIIAVSVGIVLFRAVVWPMLERYLSWRSGSRVQVARRNLRGVYVPDLNVKRGERMFWLACAGFVMVAGAVGWTILVPQS